MNNKPVNEKVKVTFFKESGKYYTDGIAYVNHHLFELEYKQDIVNTQNAMRDGWQGNYYVVVSAANEDYVGFHEALFMPHDFNGFRKLT